MQRSVGRLPRKVASGFPGFTADQWNNWITVFSPVARNHILSFADYCCWLLFVWVCFLLSNQIISTHTIDEIHHYLTHFCKCFKELYGANACTPNMHLCLHVKHCLRTMFNASAILDNDFSTAAPINNTTIQRHILRLSNSKVFTVFIPYCDIKNIS